MIDVFFLIGTERLTWVFIAVRAVCYPVTVSTGTKRTIAAEDKYLL